jgi:hypothetical protein
MLQPLKSLFLKIRRGAMQPSISVPSREGQELTQFTLDRTKRKRVYMNKHPFKYVLHYIHAIRCMFKMSIRFLDHNLFFLSTWQH